MKTLLVRIILATTFACGLALASASLLAQQTSSRVPVGPPPSALSKNPTLPVGALPLPQTLGTPLLSTGQNFDGIDFLGSNCSCLPPDTNAAAGNGFVVETVNVQLRVFDKATASVLLDEPLSALFGAGSGGDPYVLYDDIASRWYVSAFNSDDAGLFLAVSNDSNPLDGFQVYDLRNNIGRIS